jgi:glycine/D-amino acid oxidase-like deaminating enzyme
MARSGPSRPALIGYPPRVPDDYAAVSFWLETCGDDLTPRPALDGSTDADVAILGAGYSGLWTALELLKREPGLRVIILEREIAGFGASGRNGAWCTPDLNISIGELARRFGPAMAQATQQATYDAVEAVGQACAEEGIDAGWHKGGAIHVARGAHQVPEMHAAFETYARFGFGDRYRLLTAEETAARIRVEGALGALSTPDCAVVHPGRLARGLARAVERRGGVVHERTAVTGFTPRSSGAAAGAPGDRAVLHTARGDVRATTVVLAGEAWLQELPPLRRQLIPVYSLIVLSEPLDDAQWATIGWQGRECVSSFRLSVDYLSRTEDGRILFGGRGAPYHYGSAIRPDFDRHEPTHAMLEGMARAWFPALRKVAFSHAWGGPLGMARDWMPTFAYDARSGVASARGYIGHGVAISNLAGQTLADLITGRSSALTDLPMVGHHSPDWEPEPLRWLGVRYAQQAFAGIDARAERSGQAPHGPSLARWLGRH